MGLPKEISDFMEKFGVEAAELWEVRNGAYAIKHKALERVAVEKGIEFGAPTEIERDSAAGVAVVRGAATLGERTEWTYGEASPKNNKNAYPWAMAEKRLKDRLTLKLLQAHGAIYSESELDEAKTENGRPTQLSKANAREIYSKLQQEIRQLKSREQAKLWAEANKSRKDILPDDWQDTIELQFQEQMLDLKQRETV
jgi:flagellar biosynthesis GTPase FlhF